MSKEIDSFQNYYWQLQILLKMDIGAYMYVLRKRMSQVINFKKTTIGSCKFMQLAIYIVQIN